MECELKAGADKSAMRYLGAAVSVLAEARVQPLLASSAIIGWSRREPVKSKEPCPWIPAVLVAKVIAVLSTPWWLEAARTVVGQFAFTLRLAEATALQVDSCFGGEHRRGRYDRCAVMVAPSGPDAVDV